MSWKKVRLAELCRIEKGTTGIQKAISGKYPLVVTSEERKSHNEYQFDDEAVAIPLVSSTGHGHRSLNRIHFQKGKFALGSILCAVIPNDKKILSAEYLYRYLDLNKESELVSRMRGMANVTLPMKEIGQIEIPLPPLVEQEKFATSYQILEKKNNDLSTELTHQLDLVKQLRQAFLREAMQGKLVPQDSSDESASKLLKKIKAEKEQLIKEGKLKKQKELPPFKPEVIPFEIPQSWVWCNFIDIVDIQSNLVSPFKYPYSPHIAPDNIQKDTGRLIGYRTVLEDEVKSGNHYFYAGQLIYSKVRPKLNKVVKVDFEGLCSADMYPLRPRINRDFLLYCMLSEYFLVEVDKFDNRVKMPKINQSQLSQIPVPLPPLSEQHRIVAKLEQLMRYCDELEQSIKQSQTQNEQLLQQVLREALSPDNKPKGKSYKLKEEVSMAAED
ncbi:MAG: restriction endonuclease subunit S [Cyclobacteriaceae bacterium]